MLGDPLRILSLRTAYPSRQCGGSLPSDAPPLPRIVVSALGCVAAPHQTMEPRILVVDDDPGLRRFTGDVLCFIGFRVTAAASGTEGLSLLREELPDIVLLDVQMPDLDGWETLTLVRGDPRTRHLPVVMCTSQARPIDILLGWSLGCDGYIVKPIKVATLAAELRQVLSRDQAERERVRRANIAALTPDR